MRGDQSLLKWVLSNKRYVCVLLITAIFVMRNFSGIGGFDSGQKGRTLTKQATESSSLLPDDEVYDDLTIDFLSIGSMKKKAWQDGQLQTFGSHPSVRNFFLVDERNDTDKTCHTNFTDAQLQEVLLFCNNTEDQPYESHMIRKKLFWPKRHTGWLCAQKRPVDGIYAVVKHYQHSKNIPSYLMIIDDDTFVNVDSMIETFREYYPVEDNHVVAGCRFTYPRSIAFAFPYGGFGSILTRASVERLIQPIYCNDSAKAALQNDTEFNRMACWRLEQNILGEADYFVDGMCVGELMYKFSAELPFTGVRQWKKAGFCMHSDHALGYFFNFYHLAAPHGILESRELDDKIRMVYSYEYLAGDKQCRNEKYACTSQARICHYVRPERMVKFHAEQQARLISRIASNATR